MECGQSLACFSGPIVNTSTDCDWGEGTKERKALASTTSQMLGSLRKRSNYKDNGIRLLLLSEINALKKDNKKVRVNDHQFEAKCKFRGPSQKHRKGKDYPIACSQREENAGASVSRLNYQHS